MNRYSVSVSWTSTVAGLTVHDTLIGEYDADTFDDAVEMARTAAGNPPRPGFAGRRIDHCPCLLHPTCSQCCRTCGTGTVRRGEGQ